MPTVMCTRNLWRAIGGRGELPTRRLDTGDGARLGDWSALDLQTRSGPLVIALEETTYLTVVFPLPPLAQFLLMFSGSVAVELAALGVPAPAIETEVAAILGRARFAKNENRSLLGSVNDIAFHADVRLRDERRMSVETLRRVQAELNRIPHVRREPAFPDQAVRMLFCAAASVH